MDFYDSEVIDTERDVSETSDERPVIPNEQYRYFNRMWTYNDLGGTKSNLDINWGEKVINPVYLGGGNLVIADLHAGSNFTRMIDFIVAIMMNRKNRHNHHHSRLILRHILQRSFFRPSFCCRQARGCRN